MRHLIFSLCFFLFSCQENQGNPVSTAWPPLGETVKSLGNNIMVIYHDSRGMYWFGSWETGLYTFDGKTLRYISQPEGLPGNRVEEIKEDKNGIIYINTNKGLCKVINNELLLIPEAQPNLSRWSLDSNDIWFKSRSSGHVYRYDGIQLYNLKIPAIAIEEEYRKITHSQLNPYDVYCNYRDHHGNVWFGTAALGVFRYNGKSFDWITESDVNEIHNGPSNGVRSILEDKDGNFWFNSSYKYLAKDSITTQGNSFYTRLESIGSLDGKINGVLDEYLSITKDDDNNLWFATYMHGVYKYDGSKISHYAIRENDNNITLFYIYKDRHGDIWLGTQQNGLWKFNGNEFKRFSIS